MEQLTQKHCQLDAALGKWTFMLVLPAAVLQYKLGSGAKKGGTEVTTKLTGTLRQTSLHPTQMLQH